MRGPAVQILPSVTFFLTSKGFQRVMRCCFVYFDAILLYLKSDFEITCLLQGMLQTNALIHCKKWQSSFSLWPCCPLPMIKSSLIMSHYCSISCLALSLCIVSEVLLSLYCVYVCVSAPIPPRRIPVLIRTNQVILILINAVPLNMHSMTHNALIYTNVFYFDSRDEEWCLNVVFCFCL